MKKSVISSFLLLAAPVLMSGCHFNKKTEQAGTAETQDTASVVQPADSSASMAARPELPAHDHFRTVKKETLWRTKQVDEDFGDYLFSLQEVNLQWPDTLAGCADPEPLHKALTQMIFGEKAPASFQTALNRFLNTPLFNIEAERKPFQKASRKEADEGGFNLWSAAVEARLFIDSPSLIAYKVNSYSYRGGAHGMMTTGYLLFDRKSSQVFDLKHAFVNPRSKHLLQVVNQCIRSTNRHEGKSYESAQTLTTFYPTADGIAFVFQPYEIASYADGTITINVPYSMLQDELQPSFSELLKDVKSFKYHK